MHFHRTLVCWINFERPDYNISIRVFRSRDYTFRWPRYLFIPFLPCVEGGKYTNMRTILCICWVWKERRIKEKVKINKCDHCFVLNSISCLSIFNKNNKKMNRWTVPLASIDRIWPLADYRAQNHKWNEHCCEIVFNLKTTTARRIHQSSMVNNCRRFQIETLNIAANLSFIRHFNSHSQKMNLRSFPLNFNQQLFLEHLPKSKNVGDLHMGIIPMQRYHLRWSL